MPAARVRVSLNNGAIRDLLQGPNGDVSRFLRAKARQTERLAKQLAPVRTGHLRSSIEATVVRPDGPHRSSIEVVARARHALWQHEGTGVYVGRDRIRPRRGRYLALHGLSRRAGPTRSGRLRPRSARVVIVRSTRGIPPSKFLTHALAAVAAADPRLGARFLRR